MLAFLTSPHLSFIAHSASDSAHSLTQLLFPGRGGGVWWMVAGSGDGPGRAGLPNWERSLLTFC